MKFNLPPEVRRYTAIAALVLVSLLSGTGLCIALEGDQVVIKTTPPIAQVPTADGDVVKAPAHQVEKAADQALPELLDHAGKGEPLSPAAAEANEQVAQTENVGIDPTLAGGAEFSQRGCKTMPIGVNNSARTRTPTQGHAHLTVSAEREGWGDVLGIRTLFANAQFRASSNYIIDAEGHCAYIVPETRKAWTSGNMNSVAACNVEAIGTPENSAYDHPKGLAKLALVFSDCFARWGIPIQLGDTSGCNVLRAGLVDHNELECGNHHWDVCKPGEANIGRSDVCARTLKLLAAMKQVRGDTGPLTEREARIATNACRPRGSGHSQSYWRIRARHQASLITAAKRKSGKPWSFRDRGTRRLILARRAAGRCGQ